MTSELEPEALEVWHRVQAKEGNVYTKRFHEKSATLVHDLIKVQHAAEHLFLILKEMGGTHGRDPQLQIISDSKFLAAMVNGAIHELAVSLGYQKVQTPEDDDDYFLDF